MYYSVHYSRQYCLTMDDCISMVGGDDGSGNGGVNDNVLMSRVPIQNYERLLWMGWNGKQDTIWGFSINVGTIWIYKQDVDL